MTEQRDTPSRAILTACLTRVCVIFEDNEHSCRYVHVKQKDKHTKQGLAPVQL